MSFTSFLAQLLNGLAGASALFLVAAGLTLIFGVTRVVNFAHGSLYMLGAYIAYTLVGVKPGIVLTSSTRTSAPASTKKSMRAIPAQPAAVNVDELRLSRA